MTTPNVRHVCPQHAAKPLGLTRDRVNPAHLVGAHVKVGVVVPDDGDGNPSKEHIWIKVTGVNDAGELVGVIDNEPICIPYSLGERVAIKLEEIEDIYGEASA